jgi:hypothetical protein
MVNDSNGSLNHSKPGQRLSSQMGRSEAEVETLYMQLKKAIGGTDNPSGQEIAKAMMVLIVAVLRAGPDPGCIAAETGFPAGFLTAITARMCEAGLWTGDDIDEREWWRPDGRLAGIGLLCHALVALGVLKRLPTTTGANYVVAETGELAGEWIYSAPTR